MFFGERVSLGRGLKGDTATLEPGHPLHDASILSSFLAGQHVLDEGERSLHDALCVLTQTVKDSRVIYGGGWSETQVRGPCAR